MNALTKQLENLMLVLIGISLLIMAGSAMLIQFEVFACAISALVLSVCGLLVMSDINSKK